MSHYCILVEAKLFLEVYKAYHSYDPLYLICSRNKGIPNHIRNSKALVL